MVLLAIAAGCSQAKLPQATTAPSEPSIQSPAEAGSSSIPPQSDRFAQAINTGMGAAILTQSAVSGLDWNLVASRWQKAIALLKSLPTSHPKKALAQQKIAEYQRGLTYAERQAVSNSKLNPSPNTITPVSLASRKTNLASTTPSRTASK